MDFERQYLENLKKAWDEIDLEKVKGIGKRTVEKYGKELLTLVSAYRQKHHIEEVVLPDPKAAKNAAPKEEKPPREEKGLLKHLD